MPNIDPLSSRTFENLKNIEEELFKIGQTRKKAGAWKPADAGSGGQNAWKLNQEVLDAKKECAALKDEIDALRLLLTEQNILTISTGSALKELGKDFDRAKKELSGSEAHQHHLRGIQCESEARQADLSEEISLLNSEIEAQKRQNIELRKKLAREASLREELERRLPGSGREETPERRAGLSALNDKFNALARFQREERPRRFLRGYH